MVGNRLRCDLGSRSKECASSLYGATNSLYDEATNSLYDEATNSLYDEATNSLYGRYKANSFQNQKEKDTPEIRYQSFSVEGHTNWSIFKYYPNTNNEYVVARTNSANQVGSINFFFEPNKQCREMLYFSIQMSSNYETALNEKGKLTLRFDNQEVKAIDVDYIASKGKNWLYIDLTPLKDELLASTNFVFRVEDFIKDKPSYQFSLIGSRASYAKSKNICLNTNTYILNY